MQWSGFARAEERREVEAERLTPVPASSLDISALLDARPLRGLVVLPTVRSGYNVQDCSRRYISFRGRPLEFFLSLQTSRDSDSDVNWL